RARDPAAGEPDRACSRHPLRHPEGRHRALRPLAGVRDRDQSNLRWPRWSFLRSNVFPLSMKTLNRFLPCVAIMTGMRPRCAAVVTAGAAWLTHICEAPPVTADS